MSRVITFSRTFPSYHPRAGEPTYFVEKIYNWYFGSMKNLDNNPGDYVINNMITRLNPELYQVNGVEVFINSLSTGIDTWKNHTIRAGHRWKVGDWFSPRVCSGKPYHSKQIIIAPDIQIKKEWPIKIDLTDQYEDVYYFNELGDSIPIDTKKLSINDGLNEQDFYDWFDTPKNRKEIFDGQIICWNEKIEY